MNNQIQLVLKSSTAEMPLNDHELGVYLTPELDGLVGLPEIRTTSGVNSGYDGGWTSAQNYNARSITIRGVIANTDVATVERLRKQLVSLAGQGKSEELTLDLVTEAGNAYTLQVRTIALEMAMQSVLEKQEFMLQLRADDPLIYDAGESAHEATLQVAKATGGFTIDFELPLAITGGSEESVVNNDGLEEVPTIVKMYGALHNPKIINQTNNEQMQIMTDLGYAEGAWYTPSEASEGTNISLANTPDSAPFSDIQLKGSTTQNTLSGKNLFDGGTPDYTGQSAWTGYGSSNYSIVDGGYSFPDRYNAIAFEFDNLVEGEDYTFSADYVGNATFYFSVGVNMYNGGSSLPHSYQDYGAKTTKQRMTFTFTASATNRIGINSGYTSGTTLTITNIQLEKGSATAYEPYCGGTASPNPDYPQAIQTVTGENAVKICGKNLFDKDNANVLNAYFALPNDQTITSNALNRTLWIPCEPSTSYTFQAVGSNWIRQVGYTQDTPAVGVSVYGITNLNANATSVSITTGASARYLVFRFWHQNNSAETYQQALDSIQIEKGSATAYEPYQDQSYEVNLDAPNLYDTTSTYSSGGSSQNISLQASIEPGQTYTFDTNKSWATAYLYNSSDTRTRTIGGVSSSKKITFTAASNEVKAELVFYSGQQYVNVQTYDYTGIKFYDNADVIELCKIGDYQDYIWNDNGTWKVHKTVGSHTFVGDLSEAWGGGGAGTTSTNYTYIYTSYLDSVAKRGVALICDRMIGITGEIYRSTNVTSDTIGIINTTGNDAIRAFVLTSRLSDSTTAAWRTWLASNPITVYYALTTPTDTAITNSALVEQLDNLLNLSRTYQGQTNLSSIYASGNMPAILNVSYYTEKEPDTRDELIIDSRLHTVTLNGLDIYHLIGEGSEFLMLEPGENRLSLQSDITGDNGYAVVSYKQGYLSI